MAYTLSYTYKHSTESYWVSDWSDITTSDNVEIQSTYNDGVNGSHKVTGINDGAFRDCINLTSITIHNGITNIGDRAFSGCSSLTNIIIPDSVTSIGSNAFQGCTSLTSVIIGNSVTSIDYDAFRDCSKLTSVVIPDSVTSIGNGAFQDCSLLTSITIPFVGASKDGTTNTHFGYIFGANSSSGNSSSVPPSLKTVVITGGTSIGYNAFYYCSNLTSVVIPASVTSIGMSAFEGCSSLRSVYYKGTIDGWAQISFGSSFANPLYYAKKLYINDVLVTEAKLTTATKISDHAFEGCSSLTSIEIPDSVTSIGRYAFAFCTSLTSVVIPNSVTSIGSDAFRHCTSLTSIEVPDGVTSINAEVFMGCTNLTSVIIGDGVTSIGPLVFSNCSSLTQLILFPETPPTLSSYGAIPNNIQSIYVQQSSKAAYKVNTSWKTFEGKIVSDNLYLSFVRFNQKNKEYIDKKINELKEYIDSKIAK